MLFFVIDLFTYTANRLLFRLVAVAHARETGAEIEAQGVGAGTVAFRTTPISY